MNFSSIYIKWLRNISFSFYNSKEIIVIFLKSFFSLFKFEIFLIINIYILNNSAINVFLIIMRLKLLIIISIITLFDLLNVLFIIARLILWNFVSIINNDFFLLFFNLKRLFKFFNVSFALRLNFFFESRL